MEPPVSKEGSKMREQMKITWPYVWAVGGMIELFRQKCCDQILRFGGSVWAGHQNTPAKHATSLILDHTAQFLKCVATDTCIDWRVLRQEVHKQNAFSVPKHCAHYLPS